VFQDLPSLFDEFSPSVENLTREQLVELQKHDPSLASLHTLVDHPGHNYLLRSDVLLRKWRDDVSPPDAAIHQIVVPTLLRAESLHIALAISAAGCLCTQTKALLQQHVRIAMLWAMIIVMTLCVGITASLTLLIPYQLANVSECTKVPVLSLIWSGVLQPIIACFFDICELISFSVKCYHTGGKASVTSSSEHRTESTGDCLLPDDARLACYTTLFPRCGYLDSLVMSRSEDYVKTALALMLMLLIGFALALIQSWVDGGLLLLCSHVALMSFCVLSAVIDKLYKPAVFGESLLADATDARVWSLYFNFVFNSAILNLAEKHNGHRTTGLTKFLDYITVAVVTVLMVVFSLDVKCLSRFNVVFVVNISVIFVTACVIFGYVSNWSIKVNGVGGSLIPFGWTRMSADVALCFWVFSVLLLRWNFRVARVQLDCQAPTWAG